MKRGYQASILSVTRDGKRWRWTCQHVHRNEISAFACATRETRRSYATTWPRKDVEAFNVTTQPVLKEGGES